ncbi:MAG: bifunctional metallophosphatase/5'-nucleotidase [Bacilli bacterium]|nr:bifunctional metallophosphatase/5'-nucleotidase [Bacilli bacterium]
MKRHIQFIVLLSLMLPLASCGNNPEKPREDITIIYTNDIHGYIDNATKDDSGETKDGLRFSKVAGYVEALEKQGKNVLLVDAGDQVQGSVYGAMDKGETMISIMNDSGYDLATPGNHDFDFGMAGFNGFVERANFPYISCNFQSILENKLVLEPYKIFDIGGAKVGFVGISTPETITTSTPPYFQNDKGEFIYTFLGQDDPKKLYASVQNAIDSIKDKVDYVIALGHLGVGVDTEKKGISSLNVIANTSGLSAFIDGHSHTTVEQRMVKTKDQKECLLTQTGCYLKAFGEMTISKKGAFSSKLIEDSDAVNEAVQEKERALISRIQKEMGQAVANVDHKLYITNPDKPAQRLIRARETNLADLCSDCMYWYLNDQKELDCDIALINGGGIRAEIESGEATYNNIQSVHPFGNQVCLVKTKGINIKNAIEMGVSVIGEWDQKKDGPAENGGFLHIAGMQYEIDAAIPSSVKIDDNGMFVSVDGAYRVKNLKVYDKATQSYVDFDEEKEYLVGGINYLLKNSGNGLSMFRDSENVLDYIGADYVVLAEYMKAFQNGHVNNANAPMKAHQNYLYDYENPMGSNRITFLNLNENI